MHNISRASRKETRQFMVRQYMNCHSLFSTCTIVPWNFRVATSTTSSDRTKSWALRCFKTNGRHIWLILLQQKSSQSFPFSSLTVHQSKDDFMIQTVLMWHRSVRWLPHPFLDSIVVSISACHAEDRGSIPRRGAIYFFFFRSPTLEATSPYGNLARISQQIYIKTKDDEGMWRKKKTNMLGKENVKNSSS